MINVKNSGMIAVVILTICVLLMNISGRVLAAGEYDGVWVGEQNIYVPGFLSITETTGTVIYQEDEDTLNLWDPLFGSVDVVRSGNQWVLPAPVSTIYLGQTATLTSFVITTLTSNYMAGMIGVKIGSATGTATLSHTKQQCQTLIQDQILTGITGERDSLRCYEINLPPGSTDLAVQTYDGWGDCDLMVMFHRPNFENDISENDFTAEQVTVEAPESGKWYIGLIGTKGYSEVSLTATYIGFPSPVSDFTATPLSGTAPLQVTFTDKSTGSISSWAWNFGDGTTSTQQNPSHKYSFPGNYTVSLTIDGPGGGDTRIRPNYISVSKVTTPGKAVPWIPLLLLDK